MKIDIREWDYAAAIQQFTRYYEEKFQVLFFENYARSITELGRSILECSDFCATKEKMNPFFPNIPKTNISYDSITMGMLLNIAHRKLAFHSNIGFDSQHVKNLMEQANQARHIFDASSIKDFLSRMEDDWQYAPPTVYSKLDRQLLRSILMYGKLRNLLSKSKRYELPEYIKSYLEEESKILNASLIEVVDRQKIPKQYL